MHHNLWIGTILLVGAASTARAQAPACTYDRCAMRIESSFFSTRLLAGRSGTRVARLGLFPPRVREFEQASDSVRTHYVAFRSTQRTGGWLSLTSLALLVGAAIAADQTGRNDVITQGLFWSGVALSVGTTISLSKASTQLHRAVWWYNRDLPAR